MISNRYITESKNRQHAYCAVAIARTQNGINVSHPMSLGQAFQLIPDQKNIKWLLENFFKNLFRAIA